MNNVMQEGISLYQSDTDEFSFLSRSFIARLEKNDQLTVYNKETGYL